MSTPLQTSLLLVGIVFSGVVLTQTDARPVGEDEEVALTSLRKGEPGGDLEMPVPPEEQRQTLTAELSHLRRKQQQHPATVGKPRVDFAKQEEDGEAREDGTSQHHDGDPVDAKDMSWEKMGFSKNALRAIGDVVRQVERSILHARTEREYRKLNGEAGQYPREESVVDKPERELVTGPDFVNVQAAKPNFESELKAHGQGDRHSSEMAVRTWGAPAGVGTRSHRQPGQVPSED